MATHYKVIFKFKIIVDIFEWLHGGRVVINHFEIRLAVSFLQVFVDFIIVLGLDRRDLIVFPHADLSVGATCGKHSAAPLFINFGYSIDSSSSSKVG